MNLIEGILVLTMLGGAIGGVSVAILHDMGPLVVMSAALAGALVIPVGLGAVVYVIWLVESAITGDPYWPACTACGERDFKLEPSPGPTIVRCVCGQRYARNGRQCRLALPGGASRPHLRWRAFRGWTEDHEPSAATSASPADPPYRDRVDD